MHRIDLHIHSQRLKKGDKETRNITPKAFINQMKVNNVVVCSITNHNYFDLQEYQLILKEDPELVIFPGIELDVNFNPGNVKHIILICDPIVALDFETQFSNDKNRNFDEYKIEYSEFIRKVKTFKKDEIIIIPHFLDKDKNRALSRDQKDKLKEDLSDYIVILETGKLQSMGIINSHAELSLLGSDVVDWNEYAQKAQNLPRLKFPIVSFGKFIELAIETTTFIKNVLEGCSQYDIEIENNNLILYDDINVVFGEKGSGKTFLLREYIVGSLTKLGKKVVFHEGKDYQNLYENMVKEHVNTISVDEAIRTEAINCIDKFLKYKEQKLENFKLRYIDYLKYEQISKNAKLINKTEAMYIKHSNVNIKDLIASTKIDLKTIENTNNINKRVRAESSSEFSNLNIELLKLKTDVSSDTLAQIKERYVFDRTENLIDLIKDVVTKKTGKKAKPSNLGFNKNVNDRLDLLRTLQTLRSLLKKLEKTEKIQLGKVPPKNEIALKVTIRSLSKDDTFNKGSSFNKYTIVKNRDLVRKIDEFNYKKFNEINSLLDENERNINASEFFDEIVRKHYTIIRSNGDQYEPSEGEKVILSISGLLENKTYDCYIFDEIERGLGHKYISDYLIPQLFELRNVGKMIVLSTHNANLAVNTLPTHSIFCDYQDNDQENIYYSGNMYSNELISLNGTDILDWEQKALEHLEGSKEMFSGRENIWK